MDDGKTHDTHDKVTRDVAMCSVKRVDTTLLNSMESRASMGESHEVSLLLELDDTVKVVLLSPNDISSMATAIGTKKDDIAPNAAVDKSGPKIALLKKHGGSPLGMGDSPVVVAVGSIAKGEVLSRVIEKVAKPSEGVTRDLHEENMDCNPGANPEKHPGKSTQSTL